MFGQTRTPSGAHPVPAQSFRFVKLSVGAPIERFSAFLAVPHGQTHAGGNSQPYITRHYRHGCNCLASALGETLQLLHIHVQRNEGALIAPKARYDVMITSKIIQARGDGSQHFVSDVMSLSVVHLLEMVEIQYHQPDWLADAPELVEVCP